MVREHKGRPSDRRDPGQGNVRSGGRSATLPQYPRQVADYFAANWQRRFKPTRHRVAGAGSHALSSIWRAINGCRTISERDLIHVPDQDAATLVRLRASQHLAHPRPAGADT